MFHKINKLHGFAMLWSFQPAMGIVEILNDAGVFIALEGRRPSARAICSSGDTFQAGSSCPDDPW